MDCPDLSGTNPKARAIGFIGMARNVDLPRFAIHRAKIPLKEFAYLLARIRPGASPQRCRGEKHLPAG